MEELDQEWLNLRGYSDVRLVLLASLKSSGFWPAAPAALGVVLEETRDYWRDLCR